MLVAFFILGVALGESIAASWDNGPRCPPLIFPNGRVRMRSRGKIVRFNCFEGYTLVGNKYSTCVRGRWDTPTPVCVNSQCPPPPTPEHSLVATKYNGAVSIYFCEPGYVLVGAAEIFCNGRKWNATAPYCRDSEAAAPVSCDFEKGDLCWWEQDPAHDFDWQRHNRDTPSSHIGTGPSYDHTLGPGYDGYYLYIEASGRLEKDTARIVSPLYNASLTESGCFSFWYHMYGATVGALKVYFKPEGNVSRLMFEKEGNRGNRWFRGIFALPPSDTSFQIVIEGIRGSSYVSDIAIDDVAILRGDDECSPSGTSVGPEIPTNEDQIEMVDSLQSCRGRCGNGTPSADAWTTILPPGSPGACRCDLDCAQTSVCCPDFAEYCVLGANDTTDRTSSTDHLGTVTDSPIVADRIATGMRPIPISPKDDIDPYTKITDVDVETRIAPSSTRRYVAIAETTTKARNPTARGGTTAIPISATKPPIGTTTKLDVPAFVATEETPFPGYTRNRDDSRLSTRPEAHARAEQATIRHLGSSASLGASGVSAIVAATAAAILLSGLVAYAIVRKRKSYKRGGGGKGKSLSEDSDVRFLTNDEILDFNLARPSDRDEL